MRALGMLVLAIQDQGLSLGPSDPAASEVDVFSLILSAGWIEKAVVLVLIIFSAISWAIVAFKYAQLKRARAQSTRFLDVFRKSSRFSEVQSVCDKLVSSPLVGLFLSGYAELNAQLRSGNGDKPGAAGGRPTLRSLDAVDRALLRASTTELSKLEHRVTFLATTASLTPYIGLFGTVWGIITAFQDIGATGSSSLGVVAPGIAGALVATAMGLFAAIPAVYFYNDITGQIKGFTNEMEDFSMEFLTIAERNFS